MKTIKNFFAHLNEKLSEFAENASVEPCIILNEEGDVDLLSTTAFTYVNRGYGDIWFC
ncbi:MAG: hypothetical protein J6P48_05285 [Oscillospiraceae bacterium]|nr:hypothetical protein [Oscillospiraceae bacterium]